MVPHSQLFEFAKGVQQSLDKEENRGMELSFSLVISDLVDLCES